MFSNLVSFSFEPANLKLFIKLIKSQARVSLKVYRTMSPSSEAKKWKIHQNGYKVSDSVIYITSHLGQVLKDLNMYRALIKLVQLLYQPKT